MSDPSLCRYLLRRHQPPNGTDYFYEVVAEERPHSSAVPSVRSVALVHSEKAGVALVAELNARYRAGLIAGMRRFAWWADGVQMVGTCGMTLQRAIDEVEKGAS